MSKASFIELTSGVLVAADSIAKANPIQGTCDEVLYEIWLKGEDKTIGTAWAYDDPAKLTFQKTKELEVGRP